MLDLRRARLGEEVVAGAQVAVWALSSELPHRPWAILDRSGDVVACSDDWLRRVAGAGRPVAEVQLEDEDSWLTIATDASEEPGPAVEVAARSVARLLHSIVTTSAVRRQAEADADEARAVAGIDVVTQVLNAHGLWERLGAEPWAHPGDRAVAVARIAFDDLKLINQEHGFLHGDLVLRSVAQSVQRCVGSEDVIARLGGAEFVVLARDLDADELADRLRTTVRPDGASVWIGAAAHEPGEAIRATIARADLELRRRRGGPPG